jgi:hypothetical protein
MDSKFYSQTIPNREEFPQWDTRFGHYMWGVNLKEFIDQDVPVPTQAPQRKDYDERIRKAFLAVQIGVGDNHDLLVKDEYCPYKLYSRLKSRYGFSTGNDGTDAHTLAEKLFETKMKEEGDMAANINEFIRKLNEIQEAANATSGDTPAISDIIKTTQLVKNCGPFKRYMMQTRMTTKEKTYAHAVALLQNISRYPPDQIKEFMHVGEDNKSTTTTTTTSTTTLKTNSKPNSNLPKAPEDALGQDSQSYVAKSYSKKKRNRWNQEEQERGNRGDRDDRGGRGEYKGGKRKYQRDQDDDDEED